MFGTSLISQQRLSGKEKYLRLPQFFASAVGLKQLPCFPKQPYTHAARKGPIAAC